MNLYRLCGAGAAAVAAVVLAGCTTTGTTASPPPTDSAAGDAMVIEVSVGGGLVPPTVRVSDSLPRIWIAGDGRYLRQTSDPSGTPALITLEERRIPDAALAGLLEDARAAGLLESNPGYGNPRIADAMVTRVVIVTGGTRHTVLIPALGYPNPGLNPDEVAARARLSNFLDLLEDPGRIAGVSGPSDYAPTEMAVFVLGRADESTQKAQASWPMGDPGGLGVTTDWPDRSSRCLVVSGSDLASVASAAAGVNQFSPWRSAEGLWDIALRPLLPDEHSCADVVS